jgi:LacI family transcriptional regulator
LISSSNEDPELEIEEIKQLLASSVDVIMVASAQWAVDCFRRIEQHKTARMSLSTSGSGDSMPISSA